MKKLFSIVLWTCISITHATGQSIPASSANDTFYPSRQAALAAAGLDAEETEKNKKVRRQISQNYEVLEKALGSSFAGSWIEYDENKNARQIIAVTRPVTIDKSLDPERVFRIVRVRYSLQTLEATKDRIAEVYIHSKIDPDDALILSAYVDVQNNRVVARARPKDFKRAAVDLGQKGFDIDQIYIEEQNGPIKLYSNLYGGSSILISSATTMSYIKCTAGFNGAIDIYPVNITVGHCAISNLQTVYFDAGTSALPVKGAPISDFVLRDFNSGIDAAIFVNGNFAHNFSPQFLSGSSSLRSVKRPLGLQLSMLNDTVCHYGSSSGWRCAKS